MDKWPRYPDKKPPLGAVVRESIIIISLVLSGSIIVTFFKLELIRSLFSG